ncbi:MAG: NTP transferase domain-containing protein, partial [Ardenticatenia bacterium]|nr:NTP transferase domain-containing protein [Ardenticatenia bacterium]
IVLAAGQGTRMNSEVPKVIHHVAGQPMILEVIQVARALQPTTLVVVVGHGAEQVKTVVGNGVSYAVQPEPLGTGHAVAHAAPYVPNDHDVVLVLYGDTPLIRPSTLQALLDAHIQRRAAVTLLTFEPEDPTGYGRIVRDECGHIVGIVEHQEATEIQRAIRECNSGILAFQATWLWAHLPQLPLSPKGEYYLTDLVAMAVAEGHQVHTMVASDPNEVMGVNDRVQLAMASAVLFNRRRDALMRSGVTLVDPATVYIGPDVHVGRDTVIAPNVLLDGLVRIGPRCRIGPNCVLRHVVVEAGAHVVQAHLAHLTVPAGARVGPFVCREGSEEGALSF